MALPKEFLDTLEEGVKDHPSLSNFNTAQDIAKSWVGAQKLIGADKVVIPKKDADRKEYVEVLKKLGASDKIEEYVPGEIKDLPKGFTRNAEFEKALTAKAMELGVLPWQMKELMGFYISKSGESYQKWTADAESEDKKAQEVLKGEWGQAYEQNLALANKVVKILPVEDQKIIYEDMENDTRLVKILHHIASLVDESKIKDNPNTPGILTPEQAAAEIAAIQGNKDHPYFKKSHPEHKLAVERMQQLFSMQYGSKNYGE